ncbi:MAG: hypothetical protein U9R16_03825 [Campylobacterota bacterium]|nr:hypothetical protein [Campylobacterota bacterium]
MAKYLLIILTIIFISGCGSKTVYVYTYKAPTVKISSIKEVEVSVNGSEQLRTQIKSKIPVFIQNRQYLMDISGAQTFLEVTLLDKKTTYNQYENTITDYDYKTNSYNKHKKIEYLKYTESCLDTTYLLTVNLKLMDKDGIFLNKDFTSSQTESNCKNNKYEIREAFELNNDIKRYYKKHHKNIPPAEIITIKTLM